MSTIKKTIQINPELFKMGGSKTRKNKEKKEVPLIRPTNLKNKLLNRIKEHKNSEIREKEKDNNSKNDIKKEYTDEFYGALDYLSELSKKHKKDTDKIKYQTSLEEKNVNHNYNKTLKTYNSVPHVELELPPELQVPLQTYSPVLNHFSHQEPMNIQYKIDNEVPHGCLRNGLKPTYRTWKNQTRKNNTEFTDSASKINTNTNTNTNTNIQGIQSPITREQRLNMIKQKLKKLENPISNTNTNINKNLHLQTTNQIKIKEPVKINFDPIQIQIPKDNSREHDQDHELELEPNSNVSNLLKSYDNKKNEEMVINPNIISSNMDTLNKDIPQNIPSKKIIKKTIKKTYTLGKSNMYRRVGVLIKDKATRKKILNAQKDLKKVPMNDVKKYLRVQGILKVGSTAPNDVLRKMYESSRLAGEVTNTNKDILLHNFLNGDDTNTNN